jgi:membrane glycosyltransferase
MLMAPIMAIAHSVFIGGLFFGRAVVWGAQRRVVHWVSPLSACAGCGRRPWSGMAAIAWFAIHGANGALLFSPFFVGALLAVPIAVTTSLPAFGLLLARIGLWRIPDEVDPHPLVQALHLPALAQSSRTHAPMPPLLGEAATERAD